MSRHLPHSVVIVLGLLTSLAASESAPAWGRPGKGCAWGYLGDGSGVMDAAPPLRIDSTKPAWKTELPAYGHSTPIVVAGKVLVTCEPTGDCPWPRLLCLDDTDGRILWSRELNHLSAVQGLNDAQRKEAATLWGDFWRKFLAARRLRHELSQDAGRKAELQQRLDALGGVTGELTAGGYWKLRFAERQLLDEQPLAAATLTLDTWSAMGGYGVYVIGESFATPVSDGSVVYAVTAQGGFFCFSLDGELEWITHHPGQLGEYCRNGRSPIISKDLLLSDMTATLRGIDRRNGRLLWSAPVDAETYVTPTVIRVGDTDIVLCGDQEAFRLPDGKKLTVSGAPRYGCTIIAKHDEPDVAFFQGGDEHGGWPKSSAIHPPAAARFTLTGDTLTATVLWHGIAGKRHATQGGILYHAGKVYTRQGSILDALTGDVLVAETAKYRKMNASGSPSTEHQLYLANGHVFGVWGNHNHLGKDDFRGIYYNVCTADGKHVASTTLPGFNYASAFTLSGRRAYIRTSSHLWCCE